MSDSRSKRASLQSSLSAAPSSTLDSDLDILYQQSIPNAKLASRRRSQTENLAKADSPSPHRPAMEDAYMSTEARSPSPKHRSTRRHTTASKLPSPAASVLKDRTRRQSLAEEITTRYRPNLDQIVEHRNGKCNLKQKREHVSRLRAPSVSSSTSRSSYHDESEPSRGRHVTSPTGKVSRRGVVPVEGSSSLLSVITSMPDQEPDTDQSETEASSSADRADNLKASNKEHRMSGMTLVSDNEPPSCSVFDFMETDCRIPDTPDMHELSSPSASYHASSLTDSSELPGTPSSYSTFPSPTATRGDSGSTASLAELHMQHEERLRAHIPSGKSNAKAGYEGRVKRSGTRDFMKVSEYVEDDAATGGSLLDANAVIRPHSVMSHTSTGSTSYETHESVLHPPPAEQQSEHESARTYEQQSCNSSERPSPSLGSSGLDQYAMTHLPLTRQHYATPMPPTWMPVPGHLERKDSANGAEHLPPVPEAPEWRKAPPSGYEFLAAELVDARSSIKPVYRKFEALNHRTLLILQDELSEAEEQLAVLDSAIAQSMGVDVEGRRHPASRRGDDYYGHEIHHRRTILLRHICSKTEQYNRVMAGFNAMKKDCEPAEAEQIATYQGWLSKHRPIHEIETRFLSHHDDLITPGIKHPASVLPPSVVQLDAAASPAPPTWIPAMLLMLPLLLFTSIPTLAARLTVTAVLALAAGTLASTTNFRSVLPTHDLVLCGGAYLVFMVAIAVCSSV